MNSEHSSNDSEHSPTLDQQSIILPFDNNPSTQSLSQNHSAVSTSYNLIYKKSSQINMNKVNLNSIEHINERPVDAKQHRSINSNAMTEHRVSFAPRKNRQYKITIMHSDDRSIRYIFRQMQDSNRSNTFSISVMTNFWILYLVYQITCNCTKRQKI